MFWRKKIYFFLIKDMNEKGMIKFVIRILFIDKNRIEMLVGV